MSERAFHRQRPLVWAACTWGAGIWAGAAARPAASLLWAGVLCAAVLIGLLWYTRRTVIWAVCALMFFGAALYVAPAAHPHLPAPGTYQVQGTAWGLPEQREQDGRVQTLLRDITLTDSQGAVHTLPRAYWTYYPQSDAPPPMDGQRVAFTGNVYHPAPQQNPYGFDFRQYLLIRGIPAGISTARELVLTPPVLTQPADFWLQLRLLMGARLDAALGEAAPVAKALLIGDRTALSDETHQVFRDGGIAHVLAVSGLHVGILMAGVLFVLRRLHASPRMQLVVTGLLLLLYCRLLDFSAPVVRAAILTMVLLLGRVLRRPQDPLTSLSLAFVLVLLLRPMDLFAIGFQLSFLAVLGIMLLGDRLMHALAPLRLRGVWQRTAQAYSITFSATAFTAPISVATFHRFSLVGLLVGPAACAAVGMLMYLFIAVFALSLVWLPLAQAVAQPVIWATQVFLAVMAQAAAMPWAVLTLPAPPVYGMFALYLCFILLSRYVRLRVPFRIMGGALAVAAAVLIAATTMDNAPRYMQLSAGAADTAVIEDGAHTWVIDTGEHGGDLANYLLSRGRSVDTLYITHLHSDHVGGLQQLLEQRVLIREIAIPQAAFEAKDVDWGLAMIEAARNAGIPVHSVAQGDTLAQGRTTMQVLWPPANAYPGQNANQTSLVTHWNIAGLTVLSMGDLGGDYERYAMRPAQVLKTAHHGSRNSTLPPFIDFVAPQAAILTNSEALAQRAQAVTERLERAGCRVLTTQDTGCITLKITPQGILLQLYLAGRIH